MSTAKADVKTVYDAAMAAISSNTTAPSDPKRQAAFKTFVDKGPYTKAPSRDTLTAEISLREEDLTEFAAATKILLETKTSADVPTAALADDSPAKIYEFMRRAFAGTDIARSFDEVARGRFVPVSMAAHSRGSIDLTPLDVHGCTDRWVSRRLGFVRQELVQQTRSRSFKQPFHACEFLCFLDVCMTYDAAEMAKREIKPDTEQKKMSDLSFDRDLVENAQRLAAARILTAWLHDQAIGGDRNKQIDICNRLRKDALNGHCPDQWIGKSGRASTLKTVGSSSTLKNPPDFAAGALATMLVDIDMAIRHNYDLPTVQVRFPSAPLQVDTRKAKLELPNYYPKGSTALTENAVEPLRSIRAGFGASVLTDAKHSAAPAPESKPERSEPGLLRRRGMGPEAMFALFGVPKFDVRSSYAMASSALFPMAGEKETDVAKCMEYTTHRLQGAYFLSFEGPNRKKGQRTLERPFTGSTWSMTRLDQVVCLFETILFDMQHPTDATGRPRSVSNWLKGRDSDGRWINMFDLVPAPRRKEMLTFFELAVDQLKYVQLSHSKLDKMSLRWLGASNVNDILALFHLKRDIYRPMDIASNIASTFSGAKLNLEFWPKTQLEIQEFSRRAITLIDGYRMQCILSTALGSKQEEAPSIKQWPMNGFLDETRLASESIRSSNTSSAKTRVNDEKISIDERKAALSITPADCVSIPLSVAVEACRVGMTCQLTSHAISQVYRAHLITMLARLAIDGAMLDSVAPDSAKPKTKSTPPVKSKKGLRMYTRTRLTADESKSWRRSLDDNEDRTGSGSSMTTRNDWRDRNHWSKSPRSDSSEEAVSVVEEERLKLVAHSGAYFNRFMDLVVAEFEARYRSIVTDSPSNSAVALSVARNRLICDNSELRNAKGVCRLIFEAADCYLTLALLHTEATLPSTPPGMIDARVLERVFIREFVGIVCPRWKTCATDATKWCVASQLEFAQMAREMSKSTEEDQWRIKKSINHAMWSGKRDAASDVSLGVRELLALSPDEPLPTSILSLLTYACGPWFISGSLVTMNWFGASTLLHDS